MRCLYNNQLTILFTREVNVMKSKGLIKQALIVSAAVMMIVVGCNRGPSPEMVKELSDIKIALKQSEQRESVLKQEAQAQQAAINELKEKERQAQSSLAAELEKAKAMNAKLEKAEKDYKKSLANKEKEAEALSKEAQNLKQKAANTESESKLCSQAVFGTVDLIGALCSNNLNQYDKQTVCAQLKPITELFELMKMVRYN
jgi:flagellar biosynthesis GTPase FlhF